MARFVIATSGMVALLALGLAFGGAWAWAALLCITVVTYFLDRIAALAAPDHPEREFPAGDGLAALLGLVHFPLLYAGAWAVAGHGAHGPEKHRAGNETIQLTRSRQSWMVVELAVRSEASDHDPGSVASRGSGVGVT